VERPVRGDTHAGCGERSGETGPWQHRHHAPDRLNMRGRSGSASVSGQARATAGHYTFARK